MAEFKYRICPECSRILNMDFKNPTGQIFLNDLIGRFSSKSIVGLCHDCQQKKNEREELIKTLRGARPFPILPADFLDQAKDIIKVRKETLV